MAEITAKLVNDLRAKTGQGMMECKRMLITLVPVYVDRVAASLWTYYSILLLHH